MSECLVGEGDSQGDSPGEPGWMRWIGVFVYLTYLHPQALPQKTYSQVFVSLSVSPGQHKDQVTLVCCDDRVGSAISRSPTTYTAEPPDRWVARPGLSAPPRPLGIISASPLLVSKIQKKAIESHRIDGNTLSRP